MVEIIPRVVADYRIVIIEIKTNKSRTLSLKDHKEEGLEGISQIIREALATQK